MCMEDIIVMRKTVAIQNTMLVTNGLWVNLIPRNDKRVALVFPAPQANNGVLALNNLGPAFSGLFFLPGNNPTPLDIQHHGDLVTCAYWIWLNTTPEQLFWAETILLDP